MAETLLPQLQDEESRKAVIEAVLALLNRWNINETDQAKILGVTELADLQTTELLPDRTSVFNRIGYVLAIERELSQVFPYQPTKHDRWVIEPQEKLDGKTPMAIMLDQGIYGMKYLIQILKSEYMLF